MTVPRPDTATRNPLRLLCLLGGVIFLAEAAVMLALDVISPGGGLGRALLDATLLILLLVPALYLLFLRPLRRQIQTGSSMREALRESHEDLQHVFTQVETAHQEWLATLDCVKEMIILLDEEGRIRRCNQAFADFCHCSFQELVGVPIFDLLQEHEIVPPQDSEETIELCHQAQDRHYLIKVYPYKSGGLPTERWSHVVTLQDVTALKLANDELRQTSEKLRQSQAHMLQKEKMASIGQLAAGVAHEINNPVGYVMSNLGSLESYFHKLTEHQSWLSSELRRCGDPGAVAQLEERARSMKLDFLLEDVADLLRESQEGTERIRTIVQNLKTFSRVDEAQRKSVDLNECIESTLAIVWNELKYKAELLKELGNLDPIECYPQQISQVILNLLVNASQAIVEQGTIRIRSWQDEGHVHLEIADTGSGIAPEHLRKIFEPFFTTKPVGEGTGLGLSILYEIVKRHGGDVRVESTPGEGTTFALQFPRNQEAA